jgi:hypothetical protein
VTEVRLTTLPDGLRRHQRDGRHEVFFPDRKDVARGGMGATQEDAIKDALSHVWPAVKTWHLPPEPTRLVRRENAEAGPVYDFGPQPAPD